VSLSVPFWDQNYWSCILMTSVKSHKCSSIFYLLMIQIYYVVIELVRMINGGLEQLQTWFSVNRLTLNISKTNYMIFGNRRITANICVRINKEKISRVNNTQFLGVVIDEILNWKSHILSIRSKLSKWCAIMYRASSLINKHGMHFLYYYLFMPYSMYCAEVWGNTYATNIHCLVLLQKRVIWLICGANRLDHTNLLFHNVHILKIPDLVKLQTAIIMFKAYCYILPMNVQQLFRIHESRYSSRHICKFKQIYVLTKYIKKLSFQKVLYRQTDE